MNPKKNMLDRTWALRELGFDVATNPNPSHKEIKTRYHTMCKINHPDKGGDHESFVRVSKAFHILTCSESSARSTAVPDMDLRAVWSHIAPLFAKCMNDFLQTVPNAPPKRNSRVTIDANHTIQDVAKRKYVCVKWYALCQGEIVTETAYVPTFKTQREFTIESKGDQNDETGQRGDVVIRLTMIPCNHFEISNVLGKRDLLTHIKFNLYEYLYGKRVTLVLPDDTTVTRDICPMIDGDCIVIEERGLDQEDVAQGKGDLYIYAELCWTDVNTALLYRAETEDLLHRCFATKGAVPHIPP